MNPEEIYKRLDAIGIANCTEMLIEVIHSDAKSEYRRSAIKYLGILCSKDPSIGEKCFTELENIIVSQESNEFVKEAAISFGKSKQVKALKPLIWYLKKEEKPTDPSLISVILRAIADIRFDDDEIKLFIEFLDFKSKEVNETVRDELLSVIPGKLVGHLLVSLKSEGFSENLKKEIVDLLGFELLNINISFENSNYLSLKYPELIQSLVDNKDILLETIVPSYKEESKRLTEHYLTILKLLGNEAIDELIEFLQYEDFIIRRNAITLIGKLKLTDAVPSLISHLDDMYNEVSRATIKALGEIGDLSAVPELLKVLDIENVSFEYIDLDMKFYIIDAITEIYMANDGASFKYLYGYVNSDNDIVKESITYIFGEIGNEQFLPYLENFLQERNVDVRKNAIIALGKIGHKSAVEPLFKLLNDKYSYWLVKKVAVDALFNIFLKNLYIEKSEPVNHDPFFVMNMEKLIDYLNTENSENFKVKLSVIKFLEIFGGKTALSALIKQLNDFYRVVRIAASKAIKKIEERLELQEELNS